MENLYQNPVVFKIHNGTVRGDVNLCLGCRMSHRTVGSLSGRETITCNANYNHPRVMREPIANCSQYQDKNKPTLSDMAEIAWTLMTDKGGRKIGFQSPEQRNGNSGPSAPIGF